MAKEYVYTKKGTKVSMNDAALQIAEEYFGVNRERPLTKEKPIELLKLPKKVEIIKAKIPEPQDSETNIDIIKAIPLDPQDSKAGIKANEINPLKTQDLKTEFKSTVTKKPTKKKK